MVILQVSMGEQMQPMLTESLELERCQDMNIKSLN